MAAMVDRGVAGEDKRDRAGSAPNLRSYGSSATAIASVWRLRSWELVEAAGMAIRFIRALPLSLASLEEAVIMRGRTGAVSAKGPLAGVLAALLLGTVVLSVSAMPASAAGRSWMTDLGTLGGATSRGVAINVRGDIAGNADTVSATHAFLWTAHSGMLDLGTLGGTNSYAVAVNARGQVVGQAETASGATHAFRWTRHRAMQDLGTLGGANSRATGINARGQVSGSAETADGATRAFRWSHGHGMLDLGTLGGTNSSAAGINNAGQVTGTAELSFRSPAYLPSHAFRWTAPGVMQDLGPVVTPGRNESSSATVINNLGQVAGLHNIDIVDYVFRWTPSGGMQDLGVGGHSVAATAINDLGEVAGSWETHRGCSFRAFRWTSSIGVQDLGTLGTSVCASSHASAMNDRGQVAGSYSDPPYSDHPITHAMRWTSSSGMQDLGTLGGTYSDASAINALGQITGSATTAAGELHAFLWSPTKPLRCTSGHCPFSTLDRR